jgi:hypothetical protein
LNRPPLSRRLRAFRLTCAAALALATLAPPAAHAQAPSPEAVAEALFQQARDLVKQERYAEACPKLAESQRLEPKLGTLLNLAYCHEKEGKYASAWAEYTSAAAVARREGQKEREDFSREQVAAMEKKLARVILQVNAPAAGLVVSVDDEKMAGAVLGTPLPMDPGKHHVAASAPGKTAWSQDIDVPPQRAEILVTIPALEPAPAALPPALEPIPPPPSPTPAPLPPASATQPPPAPVPAVPPQPAAAPSSTPTILMGTGFGVAGVGAIVGVITGSMTLAKVSDIKPFCTAGVCSSSQQSNLATANTLANVSNVSFGFAAAGLVLGFVGLAMRAPTSAPAPKTGLTLTPIVGPGAVGLRGSF